MFILLVKPALKQVDTHRRGEDAHLWLPEKPPHPLAHQEAQPRPLPGPTRGRRFRNFPSQGGGKGHPNPLRPGGAPRRWRAAALASRHSACHGNCQGGAGHPQPLRSGRTPGRRQPPLSSRGNRQGAVCWDAPSFHSGLQAGGWGSCI